MKWTTEQIIQRLNQQASHRVDSATLNIICDHYSADRTPKVRTFNFGGRLCTCMGVLHFGQEARFADLYQLIPKSAYKGKRGKPGEDFHVGQEVTVRGEPFCLGPREIVAEDKAISVQPLVIQQELLI